MPKILQEEEIKKLWDDIVTLDMNNVMEWVSGKIKENHRIMSNGYVAALTFDVLGDSLKMHHLSISNARGSIDAAEAETMALDILGDGYVPVGPVHVENVLHFIKVI